MAAAILRRAASSAVDALRIGGASRSYAKLAVGADIVSAAPGVSLQKARSWDEGVSSKFSTTSLNDIFKGKKVVIFGLPGAYTGVCSQQHVPSYKNNIDKLKAKGIDSVICVAVNDPYVMNAWAEKLQAKDAVKPQFDNWEFLEEACHKELEMVSFQWKSGKWCCTKIQPIEDENSISLLVEKQNTASTTPDID